jgi:integrase/recombinase XerC
MVLDQLIASIPQPPAMTTAEQLILQNGLKSYFQSFLLVCKGNGLSPASILNYRGKLRLFERFMSTTGIDSPEKINAVHIRLFFEHLRPTNKPISVAGYYRALTRFFNWLVNDEEILNVSPMKKIKSPKVEKKVIRPFSTDEINKLLMVCDTKNFMGLRNRAIILSLLDTGLRLGELTRIQLRDIDLDRGVIKVMGKGARERFVRFGDTTQRAIIKYLLARRDSFLCLWVNDERRPLTSWGIYLTLNRLGKRAELTGVRCSPHTCRHYFGTTALRNGADIRQVQVLLGHSTLNMTLNYVATNASEDAIQGHRGTKEHPGFSPVDRLDMRGGVR